MLSRSGDIRDQSRKLQKKSTEVLHVLGSQFLFFLGGGGAHELLDLHYKIQPVSDHVAEFYGDRLRDLGERVANKNQTSAVKRKSVRNYI